jgi:hypothetical protein
MEWFKHDSGATQDAKIKKLLMRHGAVGYAVYFHCLELITSDLTVSNVTFMLEHDSEIIADNLRITGTTEKSGQELVEDIMRTIIDLDLLQTNNGFIYGLKLLKRLDLSMTGNQKMRNLIQEAKEHHDLVMTQSCKKRLEEKRIDKNRLDKSIVSDDTPKTKRFSKPTLEEVTDYCEERLNSVDPGKFVDYYEANGWRVGRNPMKDWKAAIRTWEKNNFDSPKKETNEEKAARVTAEIFADLRAKGEME